MALQESFYVSELSYTVFTATAWRAQSWTTASAYRLGSVRLRLARLNGYDPGTITVSIRATAGDLPTGADLTTATVAGTTLVNRLTTPEGSWIEFVFDPPIDLEAATKYAILIRSSTSQSWSYWLEEYPGTYADGQGSYSLDSGVTWTKQTSDRYFETYDAASPIDLSGSVSGSGAVSGTLSIGSYVDLAGTLTGSGSTGGPLSIVSYLNLVGTVSGSGSAGGALGAYVLIPISGAIAGIGSVSGTATLSSNWQTSHFKTIKHLVAIGNDEVWSESVAGTLIQVADSVGDINTSDMLSAFEAFQKVFIVNGANKKVLDFVNDKLTVASAFTTPPLKGDTLTQTVSGAAMIVDFVSADKTTIYGYRITTAEFNNINTVSSDNAGGDTMDPSPFTPATATARSAGPFWYTWTKHPSKSTDMPPKAYLSCLYRGRAVLSGNPNDPHQWYMSRQADLFDWDYASNDAQSAVAGTNADAGKVGDMIRALIPYHDDYLLFGCANSIWLLDGDPAAGGTLQPLSDTEGMHGAYSWCFDLDGNLWFWGSSGICMIPPGPGKPIPKTAISLPNLLEDENIDPTHYRIIFGYDKKRAGIIISITKLADGTNSCYWYDLKTDGIFPESYPDECGAYSLFYYNSNDDGYSDLLVGSKDGYIRKWSDNAKDDDIGLVDQRIDSYVLMPVMPLGGEADRYGRVRSMTIINAGGSSGGAFSDSDSIEYAFYSGESAEQVVEDVCNGAAAHTSGVISGVGRNDRIRSRIRGAYVGLKLGNSSAGETWALERVDLEVDAKGRIK